MHLEATARFYLLSNGKYKSFVEIYNKMDVMTNNNFFWILFISVVLSLSIYVSIYLYIYIYLFLRGLQPETKDLDTVDVETCKCCFTQERKSKLHFKIYFCTTNCFV